METYLDTMPLANTKYIVSIIDKSDNTISIVGTDDVHDLDYRGVRDISKLTNGNSYLFTDDEGCECEIMRIK